MKDEIQNKLDILEEYQKTKIGILPLDWKSTKFKTIFKESITYADNLSETPLYSLTIEKGVTPKTDRYERSFLIKDEENSYKIVKKNEFVYNPMNLRFGALAKHKENYNIAVSAYYNIFSVNKAHSSTFMEYYLKSERMLYLYNSIATGSLKEKQRVHFSQFLELDLPVPMYKEQVKIGQILSKWDKAIELKGKLIEQKKENKKGLMEILLTGKVRLPESDKRGKKVALKGYIKEISTKNKNLSVKQILSVTNTYGFIEQHEQFDRQIASKDLTGYKIVNRGEFAYNPSRVNVGSIDLLDKFDSGVLSPIYVVFKTDEKKLFSDYMYQFIKSSEFYEQMKKLLQGSVRQNLSFESLELMKLFIPEDINEQKSIVNILSTADEEIELLQKELELLKEQKKGLMQLLLTGIVRVKLS